ncbi:MAG TPA: efflux RND transporter periplasmic adaptor subunit [Chitinophagales bacterium]|nr:efflux RND transporter periplasmic adaptor subunit [Chitinophagales bacterium]
MKNILTLFVLLLLYGCNPKETSNEEITLSLEEHILELSDEQLKSLTLSDTTLQERAITQTLKLNGKIDVPPQNLVSVSSALGGYVKSIKLLPGMHFNKGQILAVLEDNQYIQLQQDYLTTVVQLQNSKEEFNRQKELNQSKASSDKVFQQSKLEYETLLITKQALEEKLQLIHLNPSKISVNNIQRTVNIYAPFSGYVTEVFVNTGKYVSPSDILFELVDPNDLHLNIKVFEKDLGSIKIGQQVISYTNSNSDKKHSGKIILIGKNISDERVIEVHAHFDQQVAQLIPGMYMNAEIEVPDKMSLALPHESVLSFESKEYVFKKINANKFEMIEVETGNTGNGWVEILKPLSLKDEKIILTGAYTLLMALKNKGED